MAGPKMGAKAASSSNKKSSTTAKSTAAKSSTKSSTSSAQTTAQKNAQREAMVKVANANEAKYYQSLGFNTPGITQAPVSQAVKKPSTVSFGSTLNNQAKQYAAQPTESLGSIMNRLSQTQKGDMWGSYGGIPRDAGEGYTDYQARADALIQQQADALMQQYEQQNNVPEIDNNAWVNTGNPEVDAIANEYVQSIWDNYNQFFNGLPQGLDSTDVNQLTAQVDKIYGPDLERLKKVAEDYYQRQLTYSRSTLASQKAELNKSLTRGTEDVTTNLSQAQEDVATNRKILGRSMQEAKQDVADAYAASGRAFSGKRQVDEQRAAQQYQDQLYQQQKELERQQAQGAVSTKRLGEDVNSGLAQIDLTGTNYEQSLADQKTQALQNLTDFRKQMIDSAMNNANNTSSLASSFFNQPVIGNVGTVKSELPKIDTSVTAPKFTGSSILASTPTKKVTTPVTNLWNTASNMVKRTLTSSNPVAKVSTVSTKKPKTAKTAWF
jgi:hypothetical protein